VSPKSYPQNIQVRVNPSPASLASSLPPWPLLSVSLPPWPLLSLPGLFSLPLSLLASSVSPSLTIVSQAGPGCLLSTTLG
jgi:hypothetical protein